MHLLRSQLVLPNMNHLNPEEMKKQYPGDRLGSTSYSALPILLYVSAIGLDWL